VHLQETVKLIWRSYKRSNFGRDRFDKLWDSSTNKSEVFLLEAKLKNPSYVQNELIVIPPIVW
jgi:hypothetical protein